MEKNENLLVSIVMPVYNTEKYIDRSVGGVIAQTYPHWELILVDDCSTDNSLAICQKWAEKDSRIHVVHHDQNMGIACVRTTGISVSGGEYIGFSDSDDVIHPQMYEILMSATRNDKPGIVMCDIARVPDGVNVQINRINNHDLDIDILDIENAYELLFSGSNIDWKYLSVCNKIYRKDIAKSILVTTFGCDDGAFNCTAIRMANRFIKLNTEPLYFYMQRSSSITHASFGRKNLAVMESYFDIAEEIITYVPQCFYAVAVKTFKVLLNTRYNGRKTGYSKEVAQFIHKRFPDFNKSFLQCKEISVIWKVLLSIFYYCPFTYNLFRAFCG